MNKKYKTCICKPKVFKKITFSNNFQHLKNLITHPSNLEIYKEIFSNIKLCSSVIILLLGDFMRNNVTE